MSAGNPDQKVYVHAVFSSLNEVTSYVRNGPVTMQLTPQPAIGQGMVLGASGFCKQVEEGTARSQARTFLSLHSAQRDTQRALSSDVGRKAMRVALA